MPTKTTKKRWDSYEEYLKSPEWKKVKKDFYSNYDGWDNVCEITGDIYNDDEKHKLHLHHFKYPTDWNDDSWGNLILINEDVHDFIHGNEPYNIPEDKDKENKNKFKSWLLGLWNKHISDFSCIEHDLIESEQENKILNQQLSIYGDSLTRKNKIIDILLNKIEDKSNE